MIPQIKKPSLVYGLGIISPFIKHEEQAPNTLTQNKEYLALLQEHQISDGTKMEMLMLQNAKVQTQSITENSKITLTSAAHIQIKSDALLIIENEHAGLIIIEAMHNVQAKLRIETRAKEMHMTQIRIILHKDAQMELNDFILADAQVFHRCMAALHKGSQLLPLHAYTANADIDFRSSSVHIGEHSYADMKIKAILLKGKAITQGDIKICPSASHANGYQKEDLLYIGKDAIAMPIPNLEIGNNDVKCSHGASVSSVDEEMLFYATSRGLSKEEAINLITSSFLEPLLTLFTENEKEHIREEIRQRVRMIK